MLVHSSYKKAKEFVKSLNVSIKINILFLTIMMLDITKAKKMVKIDSQHFTIPLLIMEE